MKKIAVMVSLFAILTGCSHVPDEMEAGIELRSKLLQASACSFEANITADYGDKIHIFSIKSDVSPTGDISFTVVAPESISGITGKLSGDGGELTFDDTALHFDLIAERQLSPISAPWILISALRNGYLASACREDGGIRLSVDDSYEENPLRLDIWLNPEGIPKNADILCNGRRILSVSVVKFEIL